MWIFCLYCTGRFAMLSVITNIYNKKTKGPNLMELFRATEKLKKFFWQLEMFDVCTVRISIRNNQHYALICTTPLFYILAPTCFGSSLPSSGSFLYPSELLEIQIERVVYDIMCGYVACVLCVKNIDAPMLTRVWQELEYRIDVCRVTRGAHIKPL
jgi:hypothetical protein